MSLAKENRDVYWDEEVNKDIIQKHYAPVQLQVSQKRFQQYIDSITKYLCYAAHDCTQVYSGTNPLYKYQAERLDGFGRITVYFVAGEDEDGSWIEILDFEVD